MSAPRDAASRYRSRTGIGQAEYERRLAAQGGGCAICGARPKTRRLHVDHDHKTGEVRGLTCYQCNRAMPSYLTAARAEAIYLYLDSNRARGDLLSWMEWAEKPNRA